MTRTTEENQNKRRLWTEEEDMILKDYVSVHGKGRWNRVATQTGLKRCGKSCRLRWMNYLSPDVKRGGFSEDEEDLIIRLHKLLGNRWSLIAKRVPGRTDNQVKNYWNTHLIKKLAAKERNGKLGIAEQRSKIDVSSSRSYEESKVSNTVADSSSSPCIQTSTSDEITMDKGKTSEVLDTQDPLMKDGYVSSFWIANDALELNAFSSMDFLEGYYFNLA